MAKFFKAGNFRPSSAAASLAEIVASIQRWRSLVGIMGLLTMLSVASMYFIQIHPIFFQADIDNPAVRRFVVSDTYRKLESILSGKTKSSDSYENGSLLSHDVFHVEDASQWGLIIIARIDRREAAKASPDISSSMYAANKYMYSYDYKIRLSLSDLVLFVILECLLGGLLWWTWTSLRSKHRLAFEDRVIANHYAIDIGEPVISNNNNLKNIASLREELETFHQFYLHLSRRKNGRPGISITDEYDVQDFLRALLAVRYADVRREEPVPSHGGSGSRIDFLLPVQKIGIEVKYIRGNSRDADLGAQLLTDIARYRKHQDCHSIIFFIYDPHALLDNPEGLRSSLERQGDDQIVELVIVPRR